MDSRISADKPITDPSQDRYGVAEDFVEALHNVARRWPVDDGVIVGVYGPWGIGKTSILNLLRHKLEKDTATIALDYSAPGRLAGLKKTLMDGWTRLRRKRKARLPATLVTEFSPWYYDNSVQLIGNFFASIASPFEESPHWNLLAKRLKTMGSFLSSAASAITVGGINVDVEKLFPKGEGQLRRVRSDVTDQLRVFGAAGGRLIVLVDDVDRLTKEEILDLLRLLRIAADLPALTIVVAMDEARVRRILTDAGDEGYGKEYLEKIVQVDLHVPLPTKDQLSQQLEDQLKQILDAARMDCPEELVAPRLPGFDSTFELLLDHFTTPRDLARYSNSFRSLLLASSARDLHPTDAALVELMHVFHPDLYDSIRRNKDFLIRRRWVPQTGQMQKQEKQRREERYEHILDSVGENPETRTKADKLLKKLFGDVTNPRSHKSDEQRLREGRERRIGADPFFDRYFLTRPDEGLPTRDDVDGFVGRLDQLAQDEAREEIRNLIGAIIADRPDSYQERFGIDLQFALDALGLPELRLFGEVVIDGFLGDAPSLGGRLIAATLLSAGHRRTDEEWSAEAALEVVVALTERAVERLPPSLSLDVLEYARIYRVISEEEWQRVACTWLHQVLEKLQTEQEAYSTPSDFGAFGTFLAEARSIARKLENSECDVGIGTVNDEITGFVQRNPLRLPEVLVCISILSGPNIFLAGHMHPESEARERLTTLFGSSERALELTQLFIDSGGSGDEDPHGLVQEAARVLRG